MRPRIGLLAAVGPIMLAHAVFDAWQRRGEVAARGWLARYGSDTEARPGTLLEVRDFIAGE
jgi:hypothetical protein